MMKVAAVGRREESCIKERERERWKKKGGDSESE